MREGSKCKEKRLSEVKRKIFWESFKKFFNLKSICQDIWRDFIFDITHTRSERKIRDRAKNFSIPEVYWKRSLEILSMPEEEKGPVEIEELGSILKLIEDGEKFDFTAEDILDSRFTVIETLINLGIFLKYFIGVLFLVVIAIVIFMTTFL